MLTNIRILNLICSLCWWQPMRLYLLNYTGIPCFQLHQCQKLSRISFPVSTHAVFSSIWTKLTIYEFLTRVTIHDATIAPQIDFAKTSNNIFGGSIVFGILKQVNKNYKWINEYNNSTKLSLLTFFTLSLLNYWGVVIWL